MGAYLFKPEDSASDRTWPRTIVFIEGNISAGKSTLLKALKEEGYSVWQEGVDEITTTLLNKEGENLLELFYKDMPRYAFELQLAYMANRWKVIKDALDADKADIVLVERSLLTDRHTFALQLYEDGCLSDVQWKVYNQLLDDRLEDAKWAFGGVKIKTIYLRTTPETCMIRTAVRNRNGEVEGIDAKYLQGLHDKLETWLSDNGADIVDANQESSLVIHDVLEHLS